MKATYLEETKLSKIQATDGKLKRILLLGDSIRMGYSPYLLKELSGIADVRYPEENCRNTQFTYIGLSWWRDIFDCPEKVDLVYWNNGHWDIAHWGGDCLSLNSVEQYSEMLERIHGRLASLFPNAKIIFATTTPANPNGIMGVNPRTNVEIMEYNAEARRVLEARNVVIHDLFEILKDKDEGFYSDYCHLTPEGFEYLGRVISEFVIKYL